MSGTQQHPPNFNREPSRRKRKSPATTESLALLLVTVVLGACHQSSALAIAPKAFAPSAPQRLSFSPSTTASHRHMSSTTAPQGRDFSDPPPSYQKKKPLATGTASAEVEGDTVDFDWRTVAREVFNSGDRRSVVLFDGVCNLCNGAVNFSLDHDPKGKFRFVSLQSKVGQSLLKASGKRHDDISSIVLVEPASASSSASSSPLPISSKAYFKSDAVLRIAKELDYPFFSLIGTVGPYIVPKFIRNQIYELVANNRYRFGEADSCRLDKYEDFEDRFIPDPEN